ncbi:hypothetical protein [uncultured Proteiniphilum sp.]|uniref:hypothetical protein n=1 Tax=uncultured Proteiniphilum sp. TaxID=497637 RepID=UPI0026276688|nr:hypothetical protein [uncultured Proteiniphilum sp.]
MKYKQLSYLFLALILLLFGQCVQPCEKSPGTVSGTTLQQFFQYRGDSSIIISGHRGNWRTSGYPDNSLEGLQYAVEQVPDIFFEVDPRLTKDSVIVLMQDGMLNDLIF